MAGNVTEVTDATFDAEVLKSSVPVLVDFWAAWCAPCRMVAPIVEELAKHYEGKLKVCKMDTEANPKAATSLGINSIPTLIIFKKGKAAQRMIGARSKKDFVAAIDAVLAGK